MTVKNDWKIGDYVRTPYGIGIIYAIKGVRMWIGLRSGGSIDVHVKSSEFKKIVKYNRRLK